MSKIIAIANQKGGVGKTTTSINLGTGLARKGKRVCLIDLDPQGNASQGLGFNPDQIEETISTIMDRIIEKDYGITSDFAVLHHDEGIDLIPANIELSVMEMKLLSVFIGREKILQTYIEMIRDKYDYILIDCKPSLDVITLNAFAAANSVLIPVQAQFYSAKGLEQLLGTINQVIESGLNRDLKIEGVLFTVVNKQSCNYQQVSKLIRECYGRYVNIYENYIPRSVRIEEAPAYGKSIYEYAGSKSKMAKAYFSFTEEFLEKEGGLSNE